MNVPEPLYKYTTISTASSILNTGRLRWSSPLLFNDLAEFQRMPCFEPSLVESLKEFPKVIVEMALGERGVDESKLSYLSKVMLVNVRMILESGVERENLIRDLLHDPKNADERLEEELRATFESIGLNTARVVCLTPEYNNEVMWAHYADNHKGALLGFRHIPSHDTSFLAAQPVRYSAKPPVIGSGLDFLLYGGTQELKEAALRAVSLTKDIKWQYENEWRVFTWAPDEGEANYADYVYYPDELESVCFGARIDGGLKEKLISLVRAKYPLCNLYCMENKMGRLVRSYVL